MMITRRNLFSLTLAVVGIALLAGDATPAMAQSTEGRIRLEADMSVGRTKATAKYEARTSRNRRKFTFELEKGAPGTVVTVRHQGAVLATRTIDAFGNAKVDFDTTDGHSVPAMTGGQEISVYVGSRKMMSGNLQ